jgi:large subunit ribosomal protein L25
MAQTAQVTAEVRSQVGSRANKRLRDAGKLPGVVYGHKEAVVPVVLPKKEVVNHLNKGTHVFSLALDGKAENVLVKEVQYDHLGIEVIHVDFARVNLDERVTVTVPIELKGDPVGEKDGGVLQQVLNEIEVECLVTEIPNAIVVMVGDLKIDDAIHVKELKLPPGVKPLQDEDAVVAQVKTITEEEVTPAAEEGAAEPEIIGKAKDDEAAAEAEAK